MLLLESLSRHQMYDAQSRMNEWHAQMTCFPDQTRMRVTGVHPSPAAPAEWLTVRATNKRRASAMRDNSET